MSGKRKFIVRWTEHYDCSAEVEAETAEEAQNVAYDECVNGGKSRKSDFSSTSDWNCVSSGD